MDYLVSLLLGFLQGILGALPVSSSGHMAYAEQLFGTRSDSVLLYAFGHLGAMAAAASILKKDMRMLIYETLRLFGTGIRKTGYAVSGRDEPAFTKGGGNYRKLASSCNICFWVSLVLMLILRIPAGNMFLSVFSVAIAFLISGVVLLVASRIPGGTSQMRDLPAKAAVFMGIGAGLGILPGISGIALMLTVCLACGAGKKAAIRVSYLFSVFPAAAFAVVTLGFAAAGGRMDINLTIQMIIALIGAYISGRIFMRSLMLFTIKSETVLFAVYNFVFAVIGLILHFMSA
ncbi:MAG: undecaprenyl-diphosphate phosphatase [Lachnospiraceae bacterium]|nr:undecaprenyl-diphosphate phosphatase [Lachnospiraceae bacterium]